jgi:hypothetical protein
MRFFISTALLVGATTLACHGYFNDDAAWKAYEAITADTASAKVARQAPGRPGDIDELISTWPYTRAASQARADILQAWEREKPVAADASVAKDIWNHIRQGGFVGDAPFAFPAGAAAIALAALLLGIVMPRTRFRDFMIAFLVLGAAAAWPALAPPAHQITYVGWFDPLRHVVAWFPQIAIGLMFVAGVLLAGRRGQAAQGA